MCQKCNGIIDNSKPYVNGPTDIVNQFYRDLGYDGNIFECEKRYLLPSIYFKEKNRKIFVHRFE